MSEPVVIGDAILYHGDCLDLLRTLGPGSVDAVVTDPPYGISYRNRRQDIKPHIAFDAEIQGDNSNGVGQQLITECFRRQWPICAFAYHRSPWRGHWRQWLVWDKGPAVGGGGDPRTCWKFTWELVQVGGFGKLNDKRDSAVLKYWIGQNNFSVHPTQKPASLMRYLIEKLTKPMDTILDPFMGSGTTGVACLQTGRKFIGCEIEKQYFDVACKRIKEAANADPLFTTTATTESPTPPP